MALFSGRSDPDDGDDDATSPSAPWENRGFIASAIVIGAVVVCVIVFLVVGGAGDNGQPGAGSTPTLTEPTDLPSDQPSDEPSEPAATPGDPTSGPVTPPPVNNAAGGCKAKNPDQRIPRVPPPAVSWQFDTDMLIPLQAQGGPASTDANGLRYCFAHSPTGAVLAAMVTLGQIRNPELTRTVLERRIAPGAGRTKALSENRTSPTLQKDVGAAPQFTGFKVIDYLPGRAIVALAVQVDFRSVASLPVTLLWQDGDWKVILQPDGSFNGAVAPDVLSSLDGYVRFGGA
ncbi:hypothetical protein F1D05_20120 [Kribbella qitaiheensis]|uniref:DUF8175 domain-containing protein n=1 Tax=Kribbella qitaiheensis TaxID=1544730 RepID=A0A7G6X0N3_9ACTN|nr:hypothetical protein [Kribbella qitaiheensis]QNE19798.1 hypothetical protein F1D05_20120 [Kribbella qitaiheensis]